MPIKEIDENKQQPFIDLVDKIISVKKENKETTGTGGSAIIIGSAAGVAVMGIEKIDFMWYLKKISWLALIGFTAGIFVFLLQMKM